MKWLHPLYVGDKIANNCHETIRLMEERRMGILSFCQILVLSEQEGEQIEIFPLGTLLQKSMEHRTLTVLGLAADRKEAKHLLLRMVRDCVLATGKNDLKGYFLSLPADSYTDRGEVSL